ncbi:LPXTG cell wall anchor domain-containing protein [Paenibacillus sp. TRM 82003]|nr:LPXTG cell wall anchor domain-containing protein [Kineococcus sp. TRM81007]MCI2238348.1 LPXTG cell wall anchor domain-containing protein [Kineococcus sp. TRM81007]MCI3922140.1 LPXTG cell wall anchor domain-containing protein [Paenibacillus sp. TRM 82003]
MFGINTGEIVVLLLILIAIVAGIGLLARRRRQ